MQINDFFSILPTAVLALFGCVMLLLRFDSSRPYLLFLLVAELLAAVALCVGTRPDCLRAETLDLLAGYRERFREIWLELGLQSSRDATLARLDEFEGVPEGLYRREVIPLVPPHARIRVEAYIYARPIAGCPRLGDRWDG